MSEPDKYSVYKNRWTSPLAVGAYFAVFKLLLHFIFNSNYGYFRDELYFIACGEHLAFGYPDHAPLVALMAKTSRVLLGDSLFALRFIPAVAGAFKIFLTAVLVKEFGGKYGLPKAVSPHQSYFLWESRQYTGEVLILLGASKEKAEKSCNSIEEKTEVNFAYSESYEQYKIIVCRDTKKPLPEIWQSLKFWN